MNWQQAAKKHSSLAISFIVLAFVVPTVFFHVTKVSWKTGSAHYRGLYLDLFELQSHDVDDLHDLSVYGASLPDWQLDTSREYHLSRNGKWNSRVEPTTREYHFTISEVNGVSPAGVKQNMTLINGKFPGPVIEANEGDNIVVHYYNNATIPSSLHFHGMHMNGTNHMDGVHGITQCSVAPGKAFTYNFTVDDQWGTYWYHSHYSTQYLEGVSGPMVIHSKREDELNYDYDEDVVIFLQETYFKNTYDLINDYIAPNVENQEPIPDSGLIQGMNSFDCSRLNLDDNDKGSRYWLPHYECGNSSEAIIPVTENKKYRLRVINAAGFSEFDFSVDQHVLTVMEADGTNTEPLTTEVVRIANGQRYSVILSADQYELADSFWLRGTMQSHCYDGDNEHLDLELKAILAYPNFTREAYLANSNKSNYFNIISPEIDSAVRTEDATQPVTSEPFVTIPRKPQSSKSHQLDGNVDCIELNSTLLVPKIPLEAPEPDHLIHLDASFFIGAYQISKGYFNMSTYEAYTNSSTLNRVYESLERGDNAVLDNSTSTPSWADDRMVVNINEPQVIDLVINNYDDGAHPFHLHGFQFWVLASGSGYFDPSMYATINTTNPIRRDVVQVDKFGWALIRFVADNPGIWTFHCHILWHTAAGMLMQFNVMPEQLVLQQPGEEWWGLCESE